MEIKLPLTTVDSITQQVLEGYGYLRSIAGEVIQFEHKGYGTIILRVIDALTTEISISKPNSPVIMEVFPLEESYKIESLKILVGRYPDSVQLRIDEEYQNRIKNKQLQQMVILKNLSEAELLNQQKSDDTTEGK